MTSHHLNTVKKTEKPLLYSDLFKVPQISASSLSPTSTESFSGSSFSSSSSSSSSSLSSELSSTETCGSDDEDFISELSRQMAECMLQEDDEDRSFPNSSSQKSSEAGDGMNHKNHTINNFPYGTTNNTPSMQVYQLKNQPKVREQEPGSSRRRVRGNESTQQKQFYQAEKQGKMNWRKGPSGSGMTAVFLGGSGAGSVSSGTGVFLPRGSNVPAERKKKSGCTTVLIPARVLGALELHFNRSSSMSSSRSLGDEKDANVSRNGESHSSVSVTDDENKATQLPQEWIY